MCIIPQFAKTELLLCMEIISPQNTIKVLIKKNLSLYSIKCSGLRLKYTLYKVAQKSLSTPGRNFFHCEVHLLLPYLQKASS